jgi:hypothetical protein|tara:strand:+ start:1927 stop:2319 length:393 start_codon:yes stop_codon:yes gene_type:complete
MSKLIGAAIEVHLDEPAFNLVEVNLQSPDSTGWRRYQIISVVRGERLAEYREDLGPAKSFAADAFRIPGGVWDAATRRVEVLHSVGELREIAEVIRLGPTVRPEIAPRDLISEYHDHVDKLATISRERGI